MTPIEDTAVEWSETAFSRRAGRDPDHQQKRRHLGRRPDPRGGDRGPRLQPVEHHRRLPAAGQPQPRPQGRLRRQRSTPGANALAHRNADAQRRARRGRPRRILVDQPPHPVVPAAGAYGGAQPRRLPTCVARPQPHRHRAARSATASPPVPPPIPEDVRVARTADGSYNDLSAPKMGAVGATFGRNLTPDYRPELFNEPNPVVVSREAAHPGSTSCPPVRSTFLPRHGSSSRFTTGSTTRAIRWGGGKHDVEVPMPQGKTWSNTPDGPAETTMRIAGNEALGVEH